jgi:hypothetical protein
MRLILFDVIAYSREKGGRSRFLLYQPRQKPGFSNPLPQGMTKPFGEAALHATKPLHTSVCYCTVRFSIAYHYFSSEIEHVILAYL